MRALVTEKLYPAERLFRAKQRNASDLYAALDQLLHAIHPATQRVAAQKARDVLAKVQREAL
jgi:hypothetical protein